MGSGTLVLLAHCDDEIFVWQFLRKWMKQGMSLRIVFLTDMHQGAAVRKKESERFLQEQVGIEPSQIIWLGNELHIADGSLPLHVGACVRKLQMLLPESFLVTDLVTVDWEGGHQDHDAAFIIACQLAFVLHQKSRLRAFSCYNGYRTAGLWYRAMTSIRKEKYESIRLTMALACQFITTPLRYFPSQTKTWVMLLPFMLYACIRDREVRIYDVDPLLTKSPPHAGKLYYERRGRMTWEQFQEHTREFTR